MKEPTNPTHDSDTKTPPPFPESPASRTVDDIDLLALRNLPVDNALAVRDRKEKKSRIAIAQGILLVAGALGVIFAVAGLLHTEVMIDFELRDVGLNSGRLPSGTLEAVRVARANAYAASAGAAAEGLAFFAIGIATSWFPAICLLVGLCLYILDSAMTLVLSPGTYLNAFVIVRILFIAGLYRGWQAAAARAVTAAGA